MPAAVFADISPQATMAQEEIRHVFNRPMAFCKWFMLPEGKSLVKIVRTCYNGNWIFSREAA